MKKVKYAVVGAGHLGYIHLLNLKDIPSVEITGFYEIDKDRKKFVEEKTGIKGYDSFEELLDHCDAISIVVPTKSHYSVAKSAIKHGIHIFCEKPFMASIEEAEEIIKLAKEKSVIIQIGHIERFNPALKFLQNEIKNPLFIECHRISPFNPRGTDVAVILDLMIHDIDIVLNIVDSDLIDIKASGAPILTNNIDIANARLEFKNGCIANITASRVSNKRLRKLRIFQINQYISINFLQREAELYWISKSINQDDDIKTLAQIESDGIQKILNYKKFSFPEYNPLKEELLSFINSIVNGETPPVTAEEGRNALEIAIIIEEQIKRKLERIL
ncbi:MAG: Gfo/Idh/MocA family oxidoreductase [Candidatus Marinimicrobia bacterium]|nr:Gfo/Idh/MocA family oxidoreductase [Candidatus Neomarinimicrobiota bacterium]